jgi:thiosulfate/3-mercaptopyruvate sulfurtransferase
MYSTLISVPQLQSLLASGQPVMVFDCSFELMQPEAGDAQYSQAHIPGAVRADLDRHLSAGCRLGRAPSAALTRKLRSLAGQYRL